MEFLPERAVISCHRAAPPPHVFARVGGAATAWWVGAGETLVGAIQLRRCGAQIYVADLVGIGMLRDIAPIMTGIIVTGRTGASFAAQLGTRWRRRIDHGWRGSKPPPEAPKAR